MHESALTPVALDSTQVEGVLTQRPEARLWLAARLAERAEGSGPLKGRIALARAFAASGRALPAEPAGVTGLGAKHWSWLDWARLWLLLVALESNGPSEGPDMVRALYEHGELGEQESVLRVLAYLPDAERFCALGVEACRTNATRVFEALVTNNPYPARYFDELAFNQMVMKAIFLGVSLQGTLGLEARKTTELSRMAAALASERRAAGREVPHDLQLLIQPGERK